MPTPTDVKLLYNDKGEPEYALVPYAEWELMQQRPRHAKINFEQFAGIYKAQTVEEVNQIIDNMRDEWDRIPG